MQADTHLPRNDLYCHRLHSNMLLLSISAVLTTAAVAEKSVQKPGRGVCVCKFKNQNPTTKIQEAYFRVLG